jgi:hypothetical protein
MRQLLGLTVFVLPVMFNVLFARLAKIFEYPDILRQSTSEILSKFRFGGVKLINTWWLFAATAIAFAPISAALATAVDQSSDFLLVTVSLGVLAALVQFLGLVRWPFLIPHLARESEGASETKRESIDLIFQSANRYLGVAVGEHLGYLFTGLWTFAISLSMIPISGPGQVLGIIGVIAGSVLAGCSFEFVGKHELNGWKLAGTVTPFAYIAWSLWLASVGIWIFFS